MRQAPSFGGQQHYIFHVTVARHLEVRRDGQLGAPHYVSSVSSCRDYSHSLRVAGCTLTALLSPTRLPIVSDRIFNMGRHCKTCGLSHEKPTGKACRRNIVQQQPTPRDKTEENPAVMSILQDIQQKLQGFESRLSNMEGSQHETQEQTSEEEVSDNGESDNLQHSTQRGATAGTLRQDSRNMAEVMARMAEWGLTDDEASDHAAIPQQWRTRPRKSGSVSTGMDSIKIVIDWPHFHVRKGPKCITPEYKDVTSEEFVLGYLRMLDDPASKFDRKIMLCLLKDVLEDAVDFGWDRARNFYQFLGWEVEKGRLKWSDTQQILKYRLTHSRIVLPVVPEKTPRPNPPAKIKSCTPYQTGACDQTTDHGGYRHVCDFCLRVRSVTHQHPEKDCRSKRNATSKND